MTRLTYGDNNEAVTKEIEYVYDVFDRRIEKRIDSNGDQTVDDVIHMVYDGGSIVLAFDGSGSLTNRYLHGPGIDTILADEQVVSTCRTLKFTTFGFEET